MESSISWSQDNMLEVMLKEPDDFLKVRETLSRIGVASRKERKLYQSCHILHKQGKYYIVHFKELFALDGKETNLSENDIARRNTIAKLLNDWKLVEVKGSMEPAAPLSQIKILSFKDKDDWTLETKYNIGKKKEELSVEKFSDFISEQKNEQPYKLIIFNHSAEMVRDVKDTSLSELIKLLNDTAKKTQVKIS